MITVNSDDGTFSIDDDGEIQTTSPFLKYMFDDISKDATQPHEGPVDYALAHRMMKYLPGSTVIKFTPEPRDDVVY